MDERAKPGNFLKSDAVCPPLPILVSLSLLKVVIYHESDRDRYVGKQTSFNEPFNLCPFVLKFLYSQFSTIDANLHNFIQYGLSGVSSN